LKRREVVKKLAISIPVGLVLPTIPSCSTDDGVQGVSDTKVVVIGAGAAGLYAAHLLKKEGIKVEILEASDDHGGRIRYLSGFSDFPLELGADEVIGTDNIWYDLIQSTGISTFTRSGKIIYQLDGTLGTAEDFADDTDFQIAQGFKTEIPNYAGADITVKNSMQSVGINPRTYHILNAEIGNQYGSSNDTVGMRGISGANRANATPSDQQVVQSQSHYTIINSLFTNVIPAIRYNSPVSSIDYTGEKVQISISGGEIIEADKVVIAVPVSILKDGSLSFNPRLPGSKLNAISNIGMDAGMKVALAFNANFWGSDVESIIVDGIVPRYYAPGLGRSSNNSVLAAYVMGEKAEALRGFEDQQVYDMLLEELDDLYTGNASRLVVRNIEGVIKGVVMDWMAEPYIKGSYSYPKVGSTLSRETLALKVQDTLFFAGEATSVEGDFGTVQGALESSERVTQEILEVLAAERVDQG